MGKYNDPSYTELDATTINDADIISFWQTSTGEVVKMTVDEFKKLFMTGSGCRLEKTTVQSVANGTTTIISWDDEIFDTDGYHNGTNPSRITAPTDGIYTLNASVNYTAWVTGSRYIVGVRLNGVTSYELYDSDITGGSDPTVTVSDTFSLSAGDYLEIYVFQGTGGSKDLDSVFTKCTLIRNGI